jgi:hypothetical protein
MGFIGVQPASVPLTASDITNDIINADKIADNSISEEHLDPTVITGLSALGAEPADTDEFLISDAGTLKRMDYSYIKGGGGLVATGQVDSGGNVGEITLDNKFSSTYTNYLVIVDKMTPASDGANILFRFRDDTPNTINTAAYGLVSRAYRANDNGLSSRSGDAENTFQITDAGVSNSSNKMGFKMAMWVHNPFTSTVYTAAHGTFQYHNNSGYSTGGYFQMQLHENSSPRGVRMYASTGNINGRIKIYGVVDS